ncbi:hypothetical protein CC80DRAFT_496745 [Byssothecium circinans]|uniref:Uncharacterized protein n=1 Tax=Byssothecium circinans TaxID=147558 RepID=A0A6A5TFE5_9PLEO|nr:hypothetical protein CC80DRAFT_496745 [Byssothecium circinans]
MDGALALFFLFHIFVFSTTFSSPSSLSKLPLYNHHARIEKTSHIHTSLNIFLLHRRTYAWARFFIVMTLLTTLLIT